MQPQRFHGVWGREQREIYVTPVCGCKHLWDKNFNGKISKGCIVIAPGAGFSSGKSFWGPLRSRELCHSFCVADIGNPCLSFLFSAIFT